MSQKTHKLLAMVPTKATKILIKAQLKFITSLTGLNRIVSPKQSQQYKYLMYSLEQPTAQAFLSVYQPVPF